jgi:hypothetical protein
LELSGFPSFFVTVLLSLESGAPERRTASRKFRETIFHDEPTEVDMPGEWAAIPGVGPGRRFGAVTDGAAHPGAGVVRIATYNVRSLRDDGRRRRPRDP